MNTLLAQLIIVTAQLRALRRLNLTIFLKFKILHTVALHIFSTYQYTEF